MNSSNLSGRLSRAEGRRKPCSTSTVLRERSPSYIAPSWGTEACDSSTRVRNPGGKKSSSVYGLAPGGRPVRWRE